MKWCKWKDILEFNCKHTPKGQWVEAWRRLFPAFHAALWPQGGTYKQHTGTSHHSPVWANSRSQTTLGDCEVKGGTANRSPLAHHSNQVVIIAPSAVLWEVRRLCPGSAGKNMVINNTVWDTEHEDSRWVVCGGILISGLVEKWITIQQTLLWAEQGRNSLEFVEFSGKKFK